MRIESRSCTAQLNSFLLLWKHITLPYSFNHTDANVPNNSDRITANTRSNGSFKAAQGKEPLWGTFELLWSLDDWTFALRFYWNDFQYVKCCRKWTQGHWCISWNSAVCLVTWWASAMQNSEAIRPPLFILEFNMDLLYLEQKEINTKVCQYITEWDMACLSCSVCSSRDQQLKFLALSISHASHLNFSRTL